MLILTNTGTRDISAERLYDIGPRGFVQGQAVATLAFTPNADREAYLLGVRIQAPSAADTWQLTVGGRNIHTFRVDSVGNQNLCGGISSTAPKVWDLWRWHETAYGCSNALPVPWGQTVTLTSNGGATANVEFEYVEVVKGCTKPTDANHYQGSFFRTPCWAVPPAATTVVGENSYASIVAASYVPSIFTNIQVQAGFVVDVLALWAEAAGVNTYSGAADHQSTTVWVFGIINGQRLWTRAAPGGFPSVGAASAAGSGNTVYNYVNSRFGAFQLMQDWEEPILEHPLHIIPGTTSNWGIDTTGSQTGGANYASAYLAALLDVEVFGG